MEPIIQANHHRAKVHQIWPKISQLQLILIQILNSSKLHCIMRTSKAMAKIKLSTLSMMALQTLVYRSHNRCSTPKLKLNCLPHFKTNRPSQWTNQHPHSSILNTINPNRLYSLLPSTSSRPSTNMVDKTRTNLISKIKKCNLDFRSLSHCNISHHMDINRWQQIMQQIQITNSTLMVNTIIRVVSWAALTGICLSHSRFSNSLSWWCRGASSRRCSRSRRFSRLRGIKNTTIVRNRGLLEILAPRRASKRWHKLQGKEKMRQSEIFKRVTRQIPIRSHRAKSIIPKREKISSLSRKTSKPLLHLNNQ